MYECLFIDDRLLKFRLFECHDMAITYEMWQTCALDQYFCPWYYATKAKFCDIVISARLEQSDIIATITCSWGMSKTLLKVFSLSFNAKFHIPRFGVLFIKFLVFTCRDYLWASIKQHHSHCVSKQCISCGHSRGFVGVSCAKLTIQLGKWL